MKSIALLLGWAFLASQVGFALPIVTEEPTDDPRYSTLTFTSDALARGTHPETDGALVAVMLPKSYPTSGNRRYPVVYTFHGYGGEVDELIQSVTPLADEADLPEFILVGVYGGNSFYSDSVLRGDSARMVVDEVIPLIDSRYRTIAKAEARIAAGSSMGGFATWSLGLAHPDVFSAVWASIPGAFDKNGLRDAVNVWWPSIFSDYAAVFAPDHYDVANSSAKTPRFDGTPEDNAYIQELERGFGDVEGKLAVYRTFKTPLKALRFDYGTQDRFGFIPKGTVALAAKLREAGLPVSIQDWPSNHYTTDAMITAGLFPLIRQQFRNVSP